MSKGGWRSVEKQMLFVCDMAADVKNGGRGRDTQRCARVLASLHRAGVARACVLQAGAG